MFEIVGHGKLLSFYIYSITIMFVTLVGWRFSYVFDQTVDLTLQTEKGGLTKMMHNVKIQSVNRHRLGFLREKSKSRKTTRGERVHYLLRATVKLTEEFFC